MIDGGNGSIVERRAYGGPTGPMNSADARRSQVNEHPTVALRLRRATRGPLTSMPRMTRAGVDWHSPGATAHRSSLSLRSVGCRARRIFASGFNPREGRGRCAPSAPYCTWGIGQGGAIASKIERRRLGSGSIGQAWFPRASMERPKRLRRRGPGTDHKTRSWCEPSCRHPALPRRERYNRNRRTGIQIGVPLIR